MIHFENTKTPSIIKVIGVGGGGNNTLKHMHSLSIEEVDYVFCNTDKQLLDSCPNLNKILLGPKLTEGFGSGADPKIGELATEESVNEILTVLKDRTKMAFIACGMGGGTGTGGAPVIARLCKNLGILTIGVITIPFSYEGKKRRQRADAGINQLKKYLDTIIIISNDKLLEHYSNVPFSQAFEKVDSILVIAVKAIIDVISRPSKSL